MRARWASIALMLVTFGAACGSDDEGPVRQNLTAESVGSGIDESDASSAVEVALADGRLEALLEENGFTVAEVRSAADPGSGLSGLVVLVEFDEPLADETDYPLDVCSIDTGGAPITGVAWLVDGDEVSAVSPQWGDDITCGL